MTDACAEERQRASDYLQHGTRAKLLQVVEQQLEVEPSACPIEASPSEAPLADGVQLQAQYQTFVSNLLLAHESQIELYTLVDIQVAITSCVEIGQQDLLTPDVDSSLLPYIMWLGSCGNSADATVAASCLAELVYIAPQQVLPTLDQAMSTGQPAEKVVALSCFEHCISRKEFSSSESLNVPKLIVVVASALSTNQETGDSIWPHKVRLAAIRLAKALLGWPHVRCHLRPMLRVTD